MLLNLDLILGIRAASYHLLLCKFETSIIKLRSEVSSAGGGYLLNLLLPMRVSLGFTSTAHSGKSIPRVYVYSVLIIDPASLDIHVYIIVHYKA